MGDSCVLRSCIGFDPFSTDFVRCKPVIAEAGQSAGIVYADLDMRTIRREQEDGPQIADHVAATYDSLAAPAFEFTSRG